MKIEPIKIEIFKACEAVRIDLIGKIAEESGIEVIKDQLCPPGIDLGNPKTWKVQE